MLQSRVIIVLCVYHIDAMISELFIYIYSTVYLKKRTGDGVWGVRYTVHTYAT